MIIILMMMISYIMNIIVTRRGSWLIRIMFCAKLGGIRYNAVKQRRMNSPLVCVRTQNIRLN